MARHRLTRLLLFCRKSTTHVYDIVVKYLNGLAALLSPKDDSVDADATKRGTKTLGSPA